jgi:hypothetical protein
VDPIPDQLLRKSDSAGNQTRTSGSVARNSIRPLRRYTFFYITYITSVRTSQEIQYISVLLPGTLATRPQRRSYIFKSSLYFILMFNGQAFEHSYYALRESLKLRSGSQPVATDPSLSEHRARQHLSAPAISS